MTSAEFWYHPGFTWFLRLFAFLFVLPLFLYGCYSDLNQYGWIPHTRTVDMYMEGDWLQGENRNCLSFQKPREKDNVPEIVAVACPNTSFGSTRHNIPVRFWGRVSRPDVLIENARYLHWRCTRKGEDFVCKALD